MPTKKLVVSTYEQSILITMGVPAWTIASFTGRFFEGQDFAIAVGAWTGVTNSVPVLGASMEAIPPVADDFPRVLSGAALLLVAQQPEGNVLVPRIVGGTTDVRLPWVLFATLVATALYGMTGAVFAASRYLGETLVSERLGEAPVRVVPAGSLILKKACAAVPVGKVRDDGSEAGDGQ